MIHRLRPLLVLLAALLATLARPTGYYTGIISGGTSYNTYPSASGGPTILPYVTYPEGSDGAITYGEAWDGGCSCTGPLTATFTWQPDPSLPSDPHPARVVVAQTCVALFDISGVCDNGLGDLPWYEDGGGISGEGPPNTVVSGYGENEYVHYSIVADSSGTITLPTINPYAIDGTGAVYAHTAVTYEVLLYTGFSDATVQVSSPNPVQGLAFNPTTHRQEANFTVNATITQTNGNPFPAGTTFSYTWSDPKGLLTYPAPAGQATQTNNQPLQISTSALMVGTGVGLPTCTVVAAVNGITYAGTSSYECAAIGGPITTGLVTPHDSPDQQRQADTYRHDGNDPAQPWYLTYLNYSHATLADPTRAPSRMENTQNATLETKAQPVTGNPQHPGTTVNFATLPNTFTTPGLPTPSRSPGGPDPLVLMPPLPNGIFGETVYAEGPFQNEVPTAHFHFDDGTISGDADDDSAQTLVKVTNKRTKTTTWVPLVVALSAHEPGSLVDCNDPIVLPPGGAPLNDPTLTPPASEPPGITGTTGPLDPSKYQGATFWTNRQIYRYSLLDTLNQRMPGIWVQERFTDGNPLMLRVNNLGEYWPTILKSKLDTAVIDPTDGMFSSTKIGGDYGARGLVYDELWFVWPPNLSGPQQTTHSYFAGTKDPTTTALTGVNLGAFPITFNPGAPGAASQPNPPKGP